VPFIVFPSAASASASSSASASGIAASDVCDDNLCASDSACVVSDNGNKYTCDCTAMDGLAKETVVVGRYCNITIEGKPVSVGVGDCPGCESLFVCDEAFDDSDPEEYKDGVRSNLAEAYCSCKNPEGSLLDRYVCI
jgi:hypothetical protein